MSMQRQNQLNGLVSNQFIVLSPLEGPVELWDAFKHETLQDEKECIGEYERSRDGYAVGVIGEY